MPLAYRALCGLALTLAAANVARAQASTPLGIFSAHSDVGEVLHPGSAAFDPAASAYTVTGSGENMWFGNDDFHFVWKKLSGDVDLTAAIRFAGDAGNRHRKAVLMIRQSLDRSSPAVDIAFHGDGLTSLQFRDAPGADTREVEAAISAPARVRLEKKGDRFYAFTAGAAGPFAPASASVRVPIHDDFYVGLGVCSHDKNVSETALFSGVELSTPKPETAPPTLWSVLETVNVASADRRVAYLAPAHFEAPN